MIRFLNRGTKRGEVWIYGDVGQSFFAEGMTAKSFAAELAKLGPIDTLALHINSAGGNVFEGLAIYNQLKRHPARVEVDVDGIAASIASIIALAGDEIRIAANAMMMIHDPVGVVRGDAAEMRKTAEVLDQVKQNLVDTYVERTKQKAQDVAAAMAKETWFTGAEAVQWGLADRVTGAQEIAAHFDLTQFKNPPQALANVVTLRPGIVLRPVRDMAAVRNARLAARAA